MNGFKKFHFTEHQDEIAQLVAKGVPAKEIGSRLGISSRTVEGLLAKIRRKTGTISTAQCGCKLARIAVRNFTRG